MLYKNKKTADKMNDDYKEPQLPNNISFYMKQFSRCFLCDTKINENDQKLGFCRCLMNKYLINVDSDGIKHYTIPKGISRGELRKEWEKKAKVIYNTLKE